ncbi:hypothetical protein [Kordia sp.]|uniref:hypothetical protein n=1 Tax=Kordia sp. TaxID=1965332 RepID=UPI0025C4BD1C|nr:hypothetical protein [Kordia sp.]MCH2195913.1 hypothetical protein [Kordia sp.]
MKALAILLVLFSTITCRAQNLELKPPFKNQGAQEGYWAQEFFKKEYVKTTYKVYTDSIKKTTVTNFMYTDKTFEVHNLNKLLAPIFSKGILYPQLISDFETQPKKTAKELDSLSTIQRYLYDISRGDHLIISNIEELPFLSNSSKVKRFRFWMYRPNIANPQVFLFELTNDKATKKTTLKEFVENATLTFLKAGWIVI